METYSERVTRFFLQSLHTLKKESGGQRWNVICDDTVHLAMTIGPSYFSSFFQFQKEEIWQLFFHPPPRVQDSFLLQFFSQQDQSPSFLFLLLQALTDPPSSWWQDLKS